MRSFFILSFLLITSTYAGLDPSREAIYSCRNLDGESQVYGATIHESRFGGGEIFYEVEVLAAFNGEEKSYFKRVNLVSIYNGAIEHFTTGNFRFKVNRVQSDRFGHMETFVRIPKYGIHSQDWVCKDY